MAFRSALTLLVVLAVGIPARAQDDVKALEKRVAALEADLATATANLTQALEGVQANKRDLSSLQMTIQDQFTRQQQILADLAELKQTTSDQLTRQQQILDAISTQDSSQNYIPNIKASVDRSPEFKQQFRESIQGALPKNGTFVIENKTNYGRWIWVNLQAHYLAPGETKTLDVPTGTVSSQLNGEPMMTWTLGSANDFRQVIQIINKRDLQTLQRPQAPADTAPSLTPEPTPAVPAPTAPEAALPSAAPLIVEPFVPAPATPIPLDLSGAIYYPFF